MANIVREVFDKAGGTVRWEAIQAPEQIHQTAPYSVISTVGAQKPGKSTLKNLEMLLDAFSDFKDPANLFNVLNNKDERFPRGFEVGHNGMARTTRGLDFIHRPSRLHIDPEGLGSADKTADFVRHFPGKSFVECEAMVTAQDAILMLSVILSSTIVLYVQQGLQRDDLVDFLQRASSAAVLARRHLEANGGQESRRLLILCVTHVPVETNVLEARAAVEQLAVEHNMKADIHFLFDLRVELLPQDPGAFLEAGRVLKAQIDAFRPRDLLFASVEHWDEFRQNVLQTIQKEHKDPAMLKIVERNVILSSEANKTLAKTCMVSHYSAGLRPGDSTCVVSTADHANRHHAALQAYLTSAVGPAAAVKCGSDLLQAQCNQELEKIWKQCDAQALCGDPTHKCQCLGQNVTHAGPHICVAKTSPCNRRRVHNMGHRCGEPIPDCGACCLSDCNAGCGVARPCILARGHGGASHVCGHNRATPILCANAACGNTKGTTCADVTLREICTHRNNHDSGLVFHTWKDYSGRVVSVDRRWTGYHIYATKIWCRNTWQTYCNGVEVPGTRSTTYPETGGLHVGNGAYGRPHRGDPDRWNDISTHSGEPHSHWNGSQWHP